MGETGNGHRARVCDTCGSTLNPPPDNVCPGCSQAWAKSNPRIVVTPEQRAILAEDAPVPRPYPASWWRPVVLSACGAIVVAAFGFGVKAWADHELRQDTAISAAATEIATHKAAQEEHDKRLDEAIQRLEHLASKLGK